MNTPQTQNNGSKATLLVMAGYFLGQGVERAVSWLTVLQLFTGVLMIGCTIVLHYRGPILRSERLRKWWDDNWAAGKY